MLKLEIIFDPIYGRELSFLQIKQVLAPCGYRLLSLIDPAYSPKTRIRQLDAIYALPAYLNPE